LVIIFFCPSFRKNLANPSKRVNLEKENVQLLQESYPTIPEKRTFCVYTLLWLDLSMEIALTDKIFIAM
jgi:hypothetical protein